MELASNNPFVCSFFNATKKFVLFINNQAKQTIIQHYYPHIIHSKSKNNDLPRNVYIVRD